MMNTELREPTAQERELIATLLKPEFIGRDELVEQSRHLKVRNISNDRFSLELLPPHGSPAVVHFRVPVEAVYFDTPEASTHAIATHILLHVVNGFLHELELYKDDLTEPERFPNSEEVSVLVLPIER